MADYSRLPLEHYAAKCDPWPYVIGFCCGLITSGVLMVAVQMWGNP